MKKADVRIGGTYVKRVSGEITLVTIDRECIGRKRGWMGTNLKTNREVHVKAASGLASIPASLLDRYKEIYLK